jgi:hypothetical protein
LILILFTFLESTYKMLHLLFKVKTLRYLWARQMSHEHTAFLPQIFVLFCSPAFSTPRPPPPNSVGGRGGYKISYSDIRYFQLRISVNTLPYCSYILAHKFWVWPK